MSSDCVVQRHEIPNAKDEACYEECSHQFVPRIVFTCNGSATSRDLYHGLRLLMNGTRRAKMVDVVLVAVLVFRAFSTLADDGILGHPFDMSYRRSNRPSS